MSRPEATHRIGLFLSLTYAEVITMKRILLLMLAVLVTHMLQARELPGQTTPTGAPALATEGSMPAIHPEAIDLAVPIRVLMQDVDPVSESEILFAGRTDTPPVTDPTEAGMDAVVRSDVFLLQDLPATPKPRLLPDKMSFMERGLWGEDGLFRSWGITGALTPETRKHELDVRRTMLTMHQIGGFTTLASMIATAYFGQKFLDTGTRNSLNMHQTFIPITIGLYGATALLSVLSPPPLIRRDEVSTTSIHKLLAWVHVAGMIITPILGAAIGRRNASFEEKARIHQVAGYITTGVFAASMIVITF